MTDLLYFSDHIKRVAKWIRFLLIVCGRFFIILFRWRKDIRLLQLDYAKKYQFDSSYLIIRYRFRNALWYNFRNVKKTTDNEIIILDFKNMPEMPVKLIVYGFFRRRSFFISIAPGYSLYNKSFKIAIDGINGIKTISRPILLTNAILTPTLPKIKLNHTDLKIKQPSFNQTDFL